jgi:ABC-2 type transport system permease protein
LAAVKWLASILRARAICRNELRVFSRDPAPLVILIVAPLLLIAFLGPAYAAAGLLLPGEGSSGAVHVVPGMAVTFAFALVGAVGHAFFRDHAWNTWDRLRASPASSAEMLGGKMGAAFVQAAAQFSLLFGLGSLVFGLDVHGSVPALVLVGLAFAVCVVSMGVALAAFCRTIGQVESMTNVGALVLAGLGGAVVPFALLPDWVEAIAPVDPAYWAMRGYREVIAGGGVAEVLPSLASLTGFSIVFVLAAASRFRFEEAKISWA